MVVCYHKLIYLMLYHTFYSPDIILNQNLKLIFLIVHSVSNIYFVLSLTLSGVGEGGLIRSGSPILFP